jgi:subtilase family serine protease
MKFVNNKIPYTRYAGVIILAASFLVSASLFSACSRPASEATCLPVMTVCGLARAGPALMNNGPALTSAGGESRTEVSNAPDDKPDLIIESITWSPLNPSKGDTISINATVSNQGAAMALPSTIKLYVDGAFNDSQYLENIPAGATLVKSFTWLTQQGTHSIRIVADAENTIEESDESNNERTVSISSALPDLIVESVAWTPNNPSVGANVTFSVTVRNLGAGAATYSNAMPYMDGERLDSISFDAINPGAAHVTTFIWPAQEGSHTLKIVIDPNNTILESDESNNEKTVNFLPITHDLFVKSIIWSPSTPTVGETTTISVTIGNLGRAASTPTRFHLYFGTQYSLTAPIETPIAPNSSETFDIEWTAKPGKFQIKVVIDPFDELIELNEKNNEMTALNTMTIISPDLTIDSVTWEPQDAVPGDTLTVSATIRNRGFGQAKSSDITFYVDGERKTIGNIPPMSYGNAQTMTFEWVIEEGTHSLKLVLDLNNKIPESNEDNNQKTVVYPIPPDLVISEINMSPPEPTESDNITFTITVKNEGKTDAEESSTACYIDDNYLNFVSGGTIAAGAAENLTFIWIPEFGVHTFKAVADHFEKLEESDETNNEKTLIFAVAKGTAAPSGESNPGGGGSSGGTSSTPLFTDYDETRTNIWFFSLMGVGIIIVLSYLYYEYKRRQS